MKNISPIGIRLISTIFNIKHEEVLSSNKGYATVRKQSIIEECRRRLLQYISTAEEGIYTIIADNTSDFIVVSTTTNIIDTSSFIVSISEDFSTFQVEEVITKQQIINKQIIKPFEKSKL